MKKIKEIYEAEIVKEVEIKLDGFLTFFFWMLSMPHIRTRIH